MVAVLVSLMFLAMQFCRWFLSLFSFYTGGEIQDGCEEKQFLELGRSGTITCYFDVPFHAILWYDSKDIADRAPIVRCVRDDDTEDGCVSGIHGVSPDGSLLIETVSLQHDRTFTVLKFSSEFEEPTKYLVEAIVTGRRCFRFSNNYPSPVLYVIHRDMIYFTSPYIRYDKNSASTFV